MAVTKTDPNLYCDLSAIAKGWAADLVSNALIEAGCQNFMAEIGGEVRTAGLNADGVPWRIAIETPMENGRAIYAIAGLSGVAMATSGEYRNYYDDAGIRLSHTIDPRTGKPIAHNLGSVSVIHKECAMADAYATALNVMGPDAGYDWANEHGLAAFFVIRDEDGTLDHRATDACTAYDIEVVHEAD
jgi:FAD:protein FMN transferase